MRAALSMAIDRKGLVDKIMTGIAVNDARCSRTLELAGQEGRAE